MDVISGAATAAFVVLFTLLIAVWAIRALIIIVPPNRAAVITGRKRTLPNGESVGYRSVIGGRTLRIPIIETVEWVTLETIPIEITVSNALSKGHIPLNIEAIANVKIASTPERTFHNAVERLLDKSEDEVTLLAKDTLMGSLRGVVAKLTPEEVNEDRLAFAAEVNEDASEDLHQLGFQLDVLKIQNVSDDRGYLDAIGRERAALAIRDAEIAEADATAETREREAAANQRGEVAEANANIEIAEARNRYRVRQAELDQEAESAERTSKVRAEQAEVEAQRELERTRVDRDRETYRADVIVPAEAQEEAARAEARAQAAPILERGKAEAEVLQLLYSKIRDGGDEGLAVFAFEKLPELLRIGVDAVEGMHVDRLVVLDGGDGRGMANAANQRLNGAYAFIERLSASLGLPLEEVVDRIVARVTDDDPGSSPTTAGGDGHRPAVRPADARGGSEGEGGSPPRGG